MLHRERAALDVVQVLGAEICPENLGVDDALAGLIDGLVGLVYILEKL